MRILILAFLVLALIPLHGAPARAVEELDTKITLQPMPKPADNSVGYKWIALKDGKDYVQTIIAKKGNTEFWKGSDGCTESWATTGFAPHLKWSGCASTDGEQEATLKDEVWPLIVGKTWRYKIEGSNVNGYSWNDETKCDVKAQVRIKIGLGEYDTYKVVCADPWGSRTWYVSPKLKLNVAYIRNSNNHGTTNYEFVRKEMPGKAQ